MAEMCLSTLAQSKENNIVIYNQGPLSNEEVMAFASKFRIVTTVIGSGTNIGIPRGRQSCFEHIWDNINQVKYISEIHLDMKFPSDWYQPLIEFLDSSDEPMISPGIVTRFGEMQPDGSNHQHVPLADVDGFVNSLSKLTSDRIEIGFVHPVIHKSDILREIGGYDHHFLHGKQGFEDDSLLLGYLYYMGTRTHWQPKCYLKSRVYHASMAQRTTLENFKSEIQLNLQGLMKQYGAYGFKHLARVHSNSTLFLDLYNQCTQNDV